MQFPNHRRARVGGHVDRRRIDHPVHFDALHPIARQEGRSAQRVLGFVFRALHEQDTHPLRPPVPVAG